MSQSAAASFPADAVAVVEGWSAVEAAGPDAAKFLNGFCTNDVLKLTDGTSCEAMFTDVKARVLAYGWVMRFAEERLTALLSSGRAQSLAEHLDRYLIRERVELNVLPPSEWLLGRVDPGDGVVPLTAFGEGICATAGSPPSKARMTAEAFESLRIRLGVPLDGIDVDERNLPQEVDRNEQAISFTKGCYLGQEPVARIDALGRVNWLLRLLTIDGPPPPRDAELAAGDKIVGRVTSSIGVEPDASVALAYVRREASGDGTPLHAAGRPAIVHKPPVSR